MLPVIDAHIHLNAFREEEQMLMINQLNTYNIETHIIVSNHLSPGQYSNLKPLIGYHLEQYNRCL